jgi:hypothetical protein
VSLVESINEQKEISMYLEGGDQRPLPTQFKEDSGFATLRAAKGTEIDASRLVF